MQEQQHPLRSSKSPQHAWRSTPSKSFGSNPGAPDAALSLQQKGMEARPRRWREGLGNRSSRATQHPRRGKPPRSGQSLCWVPTGEKGYDQMCVWLRVGNTATARPGAVWR